MPPLSFSLSFSPTQPVFSLSLTTTKTFHHHHHQPPPTPHSFTDSTQPLTTHISLSLFLDFPSSTIHSSALLSLFAPTLAPSSSTPAPSQSFPSPTPLPLPIPLSLSLDDPIRGRQLSLSLSYNSSLLTTFSSSSALQWLTPPSDLHQISPHGR